MSQLPRPDVPVSLSNGAVNPEWYNFFADAEAWKPFTSTVSASAGTITTATGAVRYKLIGRRTACFNLIVDITTNGTGSGFVAATLPFTTGPVRQTIVGRERASVGKMLQGEIAAGSSLVNIANYDNTYPGANGYQLVLTGVVEIAA